MAIATDAASPSDDGVRTYHATLGDGGIRFNDGKGMDDNVLGYLGSRVNATTRMNMGLGHRKDSFKFAKPYQLK